MTDKMVSYYKNAYSKASKDINILEAFEAIKNEKLIKQINTLRNEKTKEKKEKLKINLPCITVSGTFNSTHSIKDFSKYSGLIQIDFDGKDNFKNTDEIEKTKEQLIKDKYTFCCFISPSGNGVKVIAKTGENEKTHLNYYTFYEKYYSENFNLKMDKACKDISRLMFLSSDTGIYINAESETPIINTQETNAKGSDIKKEHGQSNGITSDINKALSDVEKTVLQIESNKQDITNSYQNWLKIGFALSAGLGETGRDFYHRISVFYSGYDFEKCNKQFDNCLMQKRQGINIASFFQIAKENNIDIKPLSKDIKQPKKISEENKEPKISKFVEVEKYLSSLYDIRYNEVSNDIECKPIEENDYKPLNENNIYRLLQHNNIIFSQANLTALLRSDFVSPYNPINNYFENLPAWIEGKDKDYISMLTEYVKAKEPARFKIQFEKFLVRCVACALVEGVFNKQALVFVEFEQNGGKSTFCRWLCPPALDKYIAENISTDKDSLISLSENFLINLDELATLNKTEINALKSLFSKDYVKIRRPFEKKPCVSPRRANFIGSTNKTEFLIDETGSVRWLCIEIEKIDWSYKNEIDINLVWSQAYSLFKAGFKYELTKQEVLENENANKAHYIDTAEMQLIKQFFLTASKEKHDIFLSPVNFLKFFEIKGYRNNRMSVESIGRALTFLKFEKGEKYFKERGYQRKGYFLNLVNSGDISCLKDEIENY